MNMWSSGRRRVLQDLLSQPAVRSFSLSPAQNTVVVERWWQVPLSKVGSSPRLHPRRHKIYKLVEDTKQTPKKNMELILTKTVPKLGGRGDTVLVKKCIGRNKLLPQGLAVYPSPENKQMFQEEIKRLREGKPEDRIQTRTGQLTVELLKQSKLKINKMPSDDFQLNKEIVCRQFEKKLGIVVPPHALSLPFESVQEVGEYWCEVKVNGINMVRIPVSLMPYEDQSASYQRQLKIQMQQAAADISEPAAAAAVEVVSVAAVEEVAVKAVSVAAVEEVAVKAVSVAAAEEVAVKAVSVAAAEEVAVKAVSDAAAEEVAVKAVSDAAAEEVAVKAVSDAAAEGVAVKAVSDAAAEEVAVKVVSDAAAEEVAVKVVSDAAAEEVAVKVVSDAAAEEVAVKVVLDAAPEEVAVKAESDAAPEEATVKAVSNAEVEAEAGKDCVSKVGEAAASAGVSAAAEEETAAGTPASQDTTVPPNDSPKKD
ncbi:uncharacterized protein LOC115015459 [Cottoperca gobio]|uniref:Large ribosomal subunit protein bL9m n=1 Tax=Cottoperca gobio TaxID=56716 RepID=A0A6J2QMY0_COTGO|nr:39S ribosomal protein L9, mitochondrial [Cottoperca gobio]